MTYPDTKYGVLQYLIKSFNKYLQKKTNLKWLGKFRT